MAELGLLVQAVAAAAAAPEHKETPRSSRKVPAPGWGGGRPGFGFSRPSPRPPLFHFPADNKLPPDLTGKAAVGGGGERLSRLGGAPCTTLREAVGCWGANIYDCFVREAVMK